MSDASDDLRLTVAAQGLLIRALIGRLVMAVVLKPADIEGIVGWAERLAGQDHALREAVEQLASSSAEEN